MEHEGDSDINCNWCAWKDIQRLCKGAGRVRNRSTSQNYSKYSIVEFGKTTEESHGELVRLAVTQTTVKDHQLT